jgi:hypothetical protein
MVKAFCGSRIVVSRRHVYKHQSNGYIRHRKCGFWFHADSPIRLSFSLSSPGNRLPFGKLGSSWLYRVPLPHRTASRIREITRGTVVAAILHICALHFGWNNETPLLPALAVAAVCPMNAAGVRPSHKQLADGLLIVGQAVPPVFFLGRYQHQNAVAIRD